MWPINGVDKKPPARNSLAASLGMKNETETIFGWSKHHKDCDRCEYVEHLIVSRIRAKVAEPGDGSGLWINRRR